MSAHPAASATTDSKRARLFHAGQCIYLPANAVLAYARPDSPAGITLARDAERDHRLWNLAYHRAPRSVLLCRDGSVFLVGATPAELRERLRLADTSRTNAGRAGRCPAHSDARGGE